MLSFRSLVLIAALFFAGAQAQAACQLTTDRTWCEGKKDEVLKPYGGQNPHTVDAPKAKTADECVAAAKKDATIKRKGLISKKVTTAMFDGKEVGKGEDSKPCK